MKSFIRIIATLWVFVLMILLLGSNQARAREGPLIPTQHNLPFIPPVAKPEPPKELPQQETQAPEDIPRKPLPKPIPTMDDGTRVTAEWKVMRCALYEKIPIRWIEMEKAPKDEFDNLTLDDIPLVMAIMAAESGCDPHVKSSAGAIGLMQVIPRDWLPDVRTNGMNVYVGMSILDGSLNLSEGNARLALAYYNCGVPKVEADECGSKGGVHYADHVLNFWLPYFE